MPLLALFLLTMAPPPAAPSSPTAEAGHVQQEPGRPSLTLQPGRARPGDPILITVHGVKEAPTGKLGGRPLLFYPVGSKYQAVSGLPVEARPGPTSIVVMLPSGDGLHGTLKVEEPSWPARELKVAATYTEPPVELQKRMEEDRAAFAKAFSQPFSPPRFTRNFAWPRKAGITARFGDRRIFNGQIRSQHYGLDLRGRPGDPIRAANDGVVVLVRDCFASGNTVVVDHGAGLYTVYFHLTRFAVEEGQKVKRGDLVGTVGRTGRVTGPHLHWSAKVDGLYVDPETLLKLDFR